MWGVQLLNSNSTIIASRNVHPSAMINDPVAIHAITKTISANIGLSPENNHNQRQQHGGGRGDHSGLISHLIFLPPRTISA